LAVELKRFIAFRQSCQAHKTSFAGGLAVIDGANGCKSLLRSRTLAGYPAGAFLTAKRG
jgi:hypothetical protein